MNAAEAEFGVEDGASTVAGVVTTVEILNEIADSQQSTASIGSM